MGSDSLKIWIAKIKALSVSPNSQTGLLKIAASTLTKKTCLLLRHLLMVQLIIASLKKASLRMFQYHLSKMNRLNKLELKL